MAEMVLCDYGHSRCDYIIDITSFQVHHIYTDSTVAVLEQVQLCFCYKISEKH